MTDLVKLDNLNHRNLKLANDCAMQLARQSHVINIHAVEVGKAISSFPVFLTRNSQNGNWALSALASFRQGHSLFVEGDSWTATYQPTSLQTYPFCLIQSEDAPETLSIGFDANDPSFSEQDGQALFGTDGKPSEFMQQITSLLEADVQHAAQTRHFTQTLEAMNLIKDIDIQVSYEDGSVQTLKGLSTLDEDRLKLLSGEDLITLNKNGYLMVIHAMLASIYQVNTLIRKQSAQEGLDDNAAQNATQKVTQIKLEVAKDGSVE